MKRSGTIAVLLGASVIKLMFLMYAFTMKTKADKSEEQFESCRHEVSHHYQILSDIKKELEQILFVNVAE